MARDPLLAQIHIGRLQLAMDDDDYRQLLLRLTQKDSAADLDPKQRQSIIDEMKRLGFKARPAQGRFRRASTKKHVRMIFALWGDLKREGIWRSADRTSLLAFVEKKTGKADPEWLTAEEAKPVIQALKAMKKKGATA